MKKVTLILLVLFFVISTGTSQAQAGWKETSKKYGVPALKITGALVCLKMACDSRHHIEYITKSVLLNDMGGRPLFKGIVDIENLFGCSVSLVSGITGMAILNSMLPQSPLVPQYWKEKMKKSTSIIVKTVGFVSCLMGTWMSSSIIAGYFIHGKHALMQSGIRGLFGKETVFERFFVGERYQYEAEILCLKYVILLGCSIASGTWLAKSVFHDLKSFNQESEKE